METLTLLQSLLREKEIAPVQATQEFQSLEDVALCWLSKLFPGTDIAASMKNSESTAFSDLEFWQVANFTELQMATYGTYIAIYLLLQV